jgi:hypothetical protein
VRPPTLHSAPRMTYRTSAPRRPVRQSPRPSGQISVSGQETERERERERATFTELGERREESAARRCVDEAQLLLFPSLGACACVPSFAEVYVRVCMHVCAGPMGRSRERFASLEANAHYLSQAGHTYATHYTKLGRFFFFFSSSGSYATVVRASVPPAPTTFAKLCRQPLPTTSAEKPPPPWSRTPTHLPCNQLPFNYELLRLNDGHPLRASTPFELHFFIAYSKSAPIWILPTGSPRLWTATGSSIASNAIFLSFPMQFQFISTSLRARIIYCCALRQRDARSFIFTQPQHFCKSLHRIQATTCTSSRFFFPHLYIRARVCVRVGVGLGVGVCITFLLFYSRLGNKKKRKKKKEEK